MCQRATMRCLAPWSITHPSMFLEDGCDVKGHAAAVKAQVSTPVVTVGAFTTPEEMEEVIASGMADIVAVGRQSLADPDLPLKARLGRSDEIRRCIRCNTCFGSGGGNTASSSAPSTPEIGHELEYRAPFTPRSRRDRSGGGRRCGRDGGRPHCRPPGPSGHPVRKERPAGRRSALRIQGPF